MAQAPATVLQEINGLYVALYDRAADNQGINYWAGQLGMSAAQAATTPITTAQATLLGQQFVTTQATYFLATYASLNDIQFVEALYGNIGGNAGDPTGIQYWLGQLQTAEAGGANAQAARAGIVGQFVDQMLSLDLTVGAAALGLSAAQYAAAQARQTELQNKIAISQFYANESALPGGSILATPSTTAPAFVASIDVIAGVTQDPATVVAAENAIVAAVTTQSLNPILALLTAPTQPNQTFTLTAGQDTYAGTGFDVFNAPLVANAFGSTVASLSSFDSLVSTPILFPPGSTPPIQNNFSVLNANFSGTPSPQQPGSVNIVGIPIWNIGQDLGTGRHQSSTIVITGDAVGGPNIISGLLTLNFSDDETNGTLIIGDNSSPVYEPNGANGFTINVTNAVGDGYNGVDVDIVASAFTGHDTINVTANIVGGFSTSNGSYNVPPEILVEDNNGDDYNPNWIGYLYDEFSIGAGASAGPNGAVGFQTWSINSIGAKAVATLNIIGLSGEGSSSANFINLSDDGSNTMLFANAISDGLSTDWQNVKTVNLSKTTGFVTITGLETNAQEVGLGGTSSSYVTPTASTFASSFQYYGGGGLLAADTTALTAIIGGAGNSFYDLTSLTAAAAHAGNWDGGHSTAGNSEIAFNDTVLTSGLTVTLTNISILDDVSSLGNVSVPTTLIGGVLGGFSVLENGGEATGGVINMANFAGLLPLNTAYALLAEDLNSNGGLGAPVPPGLPYTVPQILFTPPTQALPSTVTAAQALDYQNGIVPAGFQLLQFLNADGSTQTVLGADLTVFGDFTNFAVNMQDTADGWNSDTTSLTVTAGNNGSSEGATTTFSHTFQTGSLNGFNITFWDLSVAPNVNTGDTFTWFVSDDGATPSGNSNVNHSVFDAPKVIIDNYTTVNIVMPWESGTDHPMSVYTSGSSTYTSIGTTTYQDYVVLGSQQFIDQPVVTQTNATVNFFDNHADNGGSPPGAPSNLVLGDTNFTDLLLPIATAKNPAAIGVTTVHIDATSVATVINDFGTGSFEIGATDATNLNAQSTAHLVMDLPGTLTYVGTPPFGPTPSGITVNGSLLGQNLLQGTSGLVFNDTFGHDIAGNPDSFGVNGFGVFEDLVQSGGQNGGWGNDTLTGGAGWGHVGTSVVGGAVFQTFSAGVSNSFVDNVSGIGPGNTGDNFFPEGGTDVVNIAATEQGKFTSLTDFTSSSGTVLVSSNTSYENDSTVWVGFYDVCNSAGPWAVFNNIDAPNSGIGGVLDQAITDLTPTLGSGNGESFVDGYGGSTTLVTINGFHLGPQLAASKTTMVDGTFNVAGQGDTIVFGVADWATGTVGGQTVLGLVMSDGHTSVNSTVDVTAALAVNGANTAGNGGSQIFFSSGLYAGVGTQGAVASVPPPPAVSVVGGNIVLDSINGSYDSAAKLQNALSHDSNAPFTLAGTGVAANTTVDMLIAYNLTSGGIEIADLTLTNKTGAAITDTGQFNTSTATLAVHNLVLINPTGSSGLGNFDAHNIWFLA